MNMWEMDGQEIYETAPLTEYLAALDFASRLDRQPQRFVVAIGDIGSGKTVGARVFLRGRDSGASYVRLAPAGALTVRSLLRQIAGAHNSYAGDEISRHDVLTHIATESHLAPRLIIFDEAQALAKGGLIDILQWLHDEGSDTFILVGTPAFEQALQRQLGVASRVALRYQVRPPTVHEIAPIFDGFSPEAIEQIHREAGGRMREIMALRRRVFELIEKKRWDPGELAPRQVTTIAKHFLGARVA